MSEWRVLDAETHGIDFYPASPVSGMFRIHDKFSTPEEPYPEWKYQKILCYILRHHGGWQVVTGCPNLDTLLKSELGDYPYVVLSEDILHRIGKNDLKGVADVVWKTVNAENPQEPWVVFMEGLDKYPNLFMGLEWDGKESKPV